MYSLATCISHKRRIMSSRNISPYVNHYTHESCSAVLVHFKRFWRNCSFQAQYYMKLSVKGRSHSKFKY